MIDNAQLDAIVIEAAKAAGIEKRTIAEFEVFSELKIRWMQWPDTIQFKVSHYLQEAPEELIREVMEVCLRRIMHEDAREYSPQLQDWIKENRHKWVKEAAANEA